MSPLLIFALNAVGYTHLFHKWPQTYFRNHLFRGHHHIHVGLQVELTFSKIDIDKTF